MKKDKQHEGCFDVRISYDNDTVIHDFSKGSLNLELNFEVECIMNLPNY